MKSRGAQTPEFRVFDVVEEKKPFRDDSKKEPPSKPPIPKELLKINRRIFDVEDFIIDRFANAFTTHIRGAVRNPLLRNPFKFHPLFSVDNNGSLDLRLKIDLDSFQASLAQQGSAEFFISLQQTFLEVLANRSEYLNRFNKYIFRQERTLLHGAVTFLLFISGCFKTRYVTFAFEVIVVMLSELFRQHGGEAEARASLILVINERLTYWDSVEQQYFAILGNNKVLHLPIRLVVEAFFDYLVVNDFFIGYESHSQVSRFNALKT